MEAKRRTEDSIRFTLGRSGRSFRADDRPRLDRSGIRVTLRRLSKG